MIMMYDYAVLMSLLVISRTKVNWLMACTTLENSRIYNIDNQPRLCLQKDEFQISNKYSSSTSTKSGVLF